MTQAQKQQQPILEERLTQTSSTSIQRSNEAMVGSADIVYDLSTVSEILSLAQTKQHAKDVQSAVSDLSDKLKERGVATPAENFDSNKISEAALYATANNLGINLTYVNAARDELMPSKERINSIAQKYGVEMDIISELNLMFKDYKSAVDEIIKNKKLNMRARFDWDREIYIEKIIEKKTNPIVGAIRNFFGYTRHKESFEKIGSINYSSYHQQSIFRSEQDIALSLFAEKIHEVASEYKREVRMITTQKLV